MKNIVTNLKTFILAIFGLLGGFLWSLKSGWDWEPIILMSGSALEIIAFIILISNRDSTAEHTAVQQTIPNQVALTNSDKARVRILFIDDNILDFKMVSILKKSGWINTKSVRDITYLDDPKIIEADIIFVDINGVGTSLFQDQGLGLANALKSKFKTKKIIIYSAETTGDRFHSALRAVDGCLSKNAEPYQFINLIESLIFGNK